MIRCVCELVFCFFKGTAWIKDELSSINLGYQFTPVGRKSIGLKRKNKTSRLMTKKMFPNGRILACIRRERLKNEKKKAEE